MSTTPVDPAVTQKAIEAHAEAEYLLAVQKSHDTLTADLADAQRRQLEAVQHAKHVYRMRLGLE
jgi:hypothetical protein